MSRSVIMAKTATRGMRFARLWPARVLREACQSVETQAWVCEYPFFTHSVKKSSRPRARRTPRHMASAANSSAAARQSQMVQWAGSAGTTSASVRNAANPPSQSCYSSSRHLNGNGEPRRRPLPSPIPSSLRTARRARRTRLWRRPASRRDARVTPRCRW